MRLRLVISYSSLRKCFQRRVPTSNTLHSLHSLHSLREQIENSYALQLKCGSIRIWGIRDRHYSIHCYRIHQKLVPFSATSFWVTSLYQVPVPNRRRQRLPPVATSNGRYYDFSLICAFQLFLTRRDIFISSRLQATNASVAALLSYVFTSTPLHELSDTVLLVLHLLPLF